MSTPFMLTTRVGQIKMLITPLPSRNEIKILYNQNLVKTIRVLPQTIFDSNPSIKVTKLQCKASKETVVFLYRPFPKGVGQVKLQFKHSTQIGFTPVDNPKETLMTTIESGDYTLTGDGKQLKVSNGFVVKAIDSVCDRDIKICFRLRADRTAEVVV